MAIRIRRSRSPILRKAWHIPSHLVVGGCRRTLIASRCEDLQVEHPVVSRQTPAFHFYPALSCMQSTTLIGNQVVQMRQASEKRPLIPMRMVEPFHHEQFPVNG